MKDIIKDLRVQVALEKSRGYEDFRFFWSMEDLDVKYKRVPDEKDWKKMKDLHENNHMEKKEFKDRGWWKTVVKIHEEKQWAKISGMIVPADTAALIVDLGSKMPEETFEKFKSMPFTQVANIIYGGKRGN